MTTLTVLEGDITTLAVDAIVNAAAPGLGGGTGVSRAIHDKAGPQLFEAASAMDPVKRGDAAATPGFDLPAKWVIHAVGPVYVTGALGEDKTLANCYRRSLEVAAGLGARSIAFPAISTGAYRYPRDKAAQVAVSAVRAFVAANPGALDTVIFCCRNADSAEAHRVALAS
ncbi:O-acetyl-ADP-ribose deacetylase [Aerophototrophica crusticola]|uniref:O-acetyl-ADP-ribose deacetylase n=1 Tax=Aerophototrophica crusticola TaxID=1709002 RepID=A0A858R8L0_9PROT|nr:O-acetyl-ADP-ribose deacetylase [Rhodospirillaceae bacterium B3]